MLAKYTGRVTAIEHRLLVELSASSGTTLAYGHLMERVWDRRSDGDSRPMRSAVRTLRRKLGDDANNPATSSPSLAWATAWPGRRGREKRTRPRPADRLPPLVLLEQ